MSPSDLEKLAHQFMNRALGIQPDDNVWLEYQGPKAEQVALACRAVVEAEGAHGHMVNSGSDYINSTIAGMSCTQLEAHGEALLAKMKTMQRYIRVGDNADMSRTTLSPEQMGLYKAATHEMIQYRVNNTRWLVTRAPTEELAAKCGMGFKEFTKFYKDVCLADYGLMSEAVKPLQALMAEGKTVRLFSPAQETDLRFSIEDIPAVPCTGEINLPDGECFTAPVRDSIEGTIKFGPSSYDGQNFEFIRLRFEKGRAVFAEAETPERTVVLNRMLDRDEGARFAGEFAISFNPFVKHPTGDILFDEKIDGALHIALGQCYDITPNGNQSINHWDMVHIQRPDYGSGEIWINDRLVRKDGIFVVPELLALNPENLTKAVGGKLTRELDTPPKPPARPAPRR